jgi:hypothetical protein
VANTFGKETANMLCQINPSCIINDAPLIIK